MFLLLLLLARDGDVLGAAVDGGWGGAGVPLELPAPDVEEDLGALLPRDGDDDGDGEADCAGVVLIATSEKVTPWWNLNSESTTLFIIIYQYIQY